MALQPDDTQPELIPSNACKIHHDEFNLDLIVSDQIWGI